MGVLPDAINNAVRLAEDIAVVDVISAGRFELGVGVGGGTRSSKASGSHSKSAAHALISRSKWSAYT